MLLKEIVASESHTQTRSWLRDCYDIEHLYSASAFFELQLSGLTSELKHATTNNIIYVINQLRMPHMLAVVAHAQPMGASASETCLIRTAA